MKALRGVGKGIRLDEVVPTPEGFRRAEGLEEGDRIYGPNGTLVKVGVRSEIHHCPNYIVHFDDGTSLQVDDQHQWGLYELTRGNRWNWKTLSIGKMVEKGVMTYHNGERKRFKIPLTKPVQYSAQDYKVNPYLLGVWLGDGCVGTAQISTADEEIISMLRTQGFSPKHIGGYDHTVRGLSARLRAIGVIEDKHIPEEYLIGSVEQRLSLLRGLMDSDGTAGKSNSTFCSTKKELADGVRELVHSLGGKANIREKEMGEYKNAYRVHFTPNFNPFALLRKREEASLLEDSRNQYRYITSIEDVENAMPTICFAIYQNGALSTRLDFPHEKLYLASRQYIVTHNTSLRWK